MAHVGQELALGPGACFGPIPRFPQRLQEVLYLLHHLVEGPDQRPDFVARRGIETDREVARANTSPSPIRAPQSAAR